MKSSILVAAIAAISCLSSCKKTEDVKLNQYVLDSQSVVEWKGYKSEDQHHGSFSVIGRNLLVENKKLKSGEFTIPIASIQNFDLPDEMKPVLLEHLKSADFFNIALYPEATFSVTKVSIYNGKDEKAVEGANVLLTGNFTLLNQTHPITFPARLSIENGKLDAEAILKIDRTKWGMTSYSDQSAELYIYPEVDLHLKISGHQE